MVLPAIRPRQVPTPRRTSKHGDPVRVCSPRHSIYFPTPIPTTTALELPSAETFRAGSPPLWPTHGVTLWILLPVRIRGVDIPAITAGKSVQTGDTETPTSIG